MKRLLLCAWLLAVIGCGSSPTLDTTSEESFNASLKTMSDKLSTEDKNRLASSIRLFVLRSPVDPDFLKKYIGGEMPKTEVVKELHGLTAQQIIAKAEAMK